MKYALLFNYIELIDNYLKIDYNVQLFIFHSSRKINKTHKNNKITENIQNKMLVIIATFWFF